MHDVTNMILCLRATAPHRRRPRDSAHGGVLSGRRDATQAPTTIINFCKQ